MFFVTLSRQNCQQLSMRSIIIEYFGVDYNDFIGNSKQQIPKKWRTNLKIVTISMALIKFYIKITFGIEK